MNSHEQNLRESAKGETMEHARAKRSRECDNDEAGGFSKLPRVGGAVIPLTEAKAAAHRRTGRKRQKEEFKFPTEPQTIVVIKKPRTIMNHSYRDFSRVPPELNYQPPEDLDSMTFSQKVHEILSTEEYSPYISWMPHGRSFRIHIPKIFEEQICPKYFGHCRYSSFLRSLNNYGLKHITKGTDRNCYYHECFLRGLPHLCIYMPQPKNARRLIPDPDNEPNFYKLAEQFPLLDDEVEKGAEAALTVEAAAPPQPRLPVAAAAAANPKTVAEDVDLTTAAEPAAAVLQQTTALLPQTAALRDAVLPGSVLPMGSSFAPRANARAVSLLHQLTEAPRFALMPTTAGLTGVDRGISPYRLMPSTLGLSTPQVYRRSQILPPTTVLESNIIDAALGLGALPSSTRDPQFYRGFPF